MNDIQQAREWAHDMHRVESECGGVRQDTLAAAEIIQSLPDQWINADKVREVVERMKTSISDCPEEDGEWVAGYDASTEVWIGVLESLLPAPKLLTLADMTPEERAAQKWSQAKVFPTASTLGIITGVDEYAHSAMILFTDGMVKNVPWGEITPLPDLPKLEWPAQGPRPEYRPNLGPITLSPPTREEDAEVRKQFEEPVPSELPRPEDVPAEEPWIVLCCGKKWVGVRADIPTRPWSITRMDGLDHQNMADSYITLISRLVSEAKP